MDIAALVSKVSHATFEVDAVRVRNAVSTPIKVVVHQDLQDWVPAEMGQLLTRQDQISVRAEYDLQQNDVVTVTDRSAVAKDMSWTVTGRSPESGDGHVNHWKVKVNL